MEYTAPGADNQGSNAIDAANAANEAGASMERYQAAGQEANNSLAASSGLSGVGSAALGAMAGLAAAASEVVSGLGAAAWNFAAGQAAVMYNVPGAGATFNPYPASAAISQALTVPAPSSVLAGRSYAVSSMILPLFVREAGEQAEFEGVRALLATDLGLTGRGLAELIGTVTNAGSTRVLTVDMIRAAEGATIPVSELRAAIPNILDAARAAGVRTLQIDATFANPRLQSFVFDQAARYGGTAA